MPFCSNCGAELEAGAKFCGGCGQPLGDVGKGRSEEIIEELTPMVEPPVKKGGRWKKTVVLAVIFLFVVGVIFVIGSNLDYWVQHNKFGLGKLSWLYPSLKSKETKISPQKPAPVKPTPAPPPTQPSPQIKVPEQERFVYSKPTPIEPQRVIPEAKTKISYIGVEVQNLTKEVANSVGLTEGAGILVRSVKPSGPAELAGILPGDVILKFKDTWVTDTRIFTEMVRTTPPGTGSPVYIDRRGKRLYLSVVIGETKREDLALNEEKRRLARDNYEQGVQRAKAKDFDSAIEYFKKATDYNPQESFYYMELANAYYRSGKSDLAIPNLQKAISLRPQFSPYYLLGFIYWEKGQYQEAIDALMEALRLGAPDDQKGSSANRTLGICYFKTGRMEEARRSFENAYQLDPQNPTNIYNLALHYDRLNYKREAIHYYKAYLNTKDNNLEKNSWVEKRLRVLTGNP